MKRRDMFIMISGLVSGGTILGTGAFSSVEANRTVSVKTADDLNAFLELNALAKTDRNGDFTGRSSSAGSIVRFDIPGAFGGESDAEGVGLDSTYEFHDLLKIVNQGTQSVQVTSNYTGDAFTELALVNDDGIVNEELSVGEGVTVGLLINTGNSSIGEFNETLTIVASNPD